MLGDQFGFLGIHWARAQGALAEEPSKQGDQLGLIAILVEEGLLDDKTVYQTGGSSATLKEHLFAFAQNVQNRSPHSLAFVMAVDPQESTFKIASVLEKLYFEGMDTDLLDSSNLNDDRIAEDDNKLIGVITVGQVPMPVVYESDGSTHPSLYPYTDFDQKRYIYNHNSGHFELNDKVKNPNPEVWHGVIAPPSRGQVARQELADFFYKNNQYSIGNPEYADFSKRLLYANFPALEASLNPLDYRNYEHWLTYLEEIAFQRFNKHLLKDLIARVSSELGSASPIMSDEAINSLSDTGTEFAMTQYLSSFAQTLRTYIGKLNEKIETTGRWAASEYDSPASLVTIRDEYMKNILTAKSVELEQAVDEAIRQTAENLALPMRVTVNARVCEENEPPCNDPESQSSFTLDGFFLGQRVSSMISPSQCMYFKGQDPLPGQTRLQNNSVLVSANRTYNLETGIDWREGEDNDDYEDRLEYNRGLYAGCFGNNALELHMDDIDASPTYCRPREALYPVQDILGSREIGNSPHPDWSSCDWRWMSFHQLNENAALENVYNFPDKLDDLYDEDTIDYRISPVPLSPRLNLDYGDWIDLFYNQMRARGLITEEETNDPFRRNAYVIAALLRSGQSFNFNVDLGSGALSETLTLEMRVAPEWKFIPSLERNVEPTDETIRRIKEKQFTPSTPADGIRSVEFLQGGRHQEFEYFNLFRVPGVTPGEVADNLIQMIQEKDRELNEKLGRTANVITRFFLQNSDLIEPIVWRHLGIDQKLAMIQHKYMDLASSMPVPPQGPGQIQLPPAIRPNGYEVWHLKAKGDETGLEFGVNQAMGRASLGTGEQSEEEREDAEGGSSEPPANTEGGVSGNQSYLCGDPRGVEIWDWFNAIDCWFRNEIDPAEGLFHLDNSCSARGAGLPAPTEEEELLMDPLALDLNLPAQLNLTMERRTLMPGEVAPLKVQALDRNGKELFGYIADPVNLALQNQSIGSFSKNDFNLFTSAETVEFTAQEIGQSELQATLGTVQAYPLRLRVVPEIKVNFGEPVLSQTEGRVLYRLPLFLVDQNDQRIDDIDTNLQLVTLEPLAGAFAGGGVIKIQQGQGEAIFSPSPAIRAVSITANHPFYTSETLSLTPPANPPHHLVIEAPKFFEVGENTNMEVRVVDRFNQLSSEFTGVLTSLIDPESQEFAEMGQLSVALSGGRGQMSLRSKGKTGFVKFTLSHPQLLTAEIERPILARLESEDIANSYPETLVASIVGFPAADFLRENYFAGRHLFRGRTQSVFGFLESPRPPDLLRISPRYKIERLAPRQKVEVRPLGNRLSLAVVDTATLRTLASTNIALRLRAVLPLEEAPPAGGAPSGAGLDSNTLLVRLTGDSHTLQPFSNGLKILDSQENAVAEFTPNHLNVFGTGYSLEYNENSDFDGLELSLIYNGNSVAQLIFNLDPQAFSASNFGVDEDLTARPIYTGISTSDPVGLALFDPLAEAPEDELGEHFGFEGPNRYITEFAGGNSIGEAIKNNLPTNAVLLGDPTIRLRPANQSPLNYDNTVGRRIFNDPNGVGVKALTNFNFNNDGYPDVAAVMQDGRIKLFTGGPTDPLFTDRGDLAFLGDGTIAVEALDLAQDGYEDLVVSTAEGRLAILHNDREVIRRTDQKLNVGKQVYTLLKGDMDADSFPDLVTLDSRGDIRIFYSSAEGLPEAGTLIGNYGFSLSSADLSRDLDIRYPGLHAPQSNSSQLPPLLPWSEGDETQTYFAPIENINFVRAAKSVQNASRPGERGGVDLEEVLQYSITLRATGNANNVVVADRVPDALELDLSSIECQGTGCGSFAPEQNGILLFLGPLSFRAGQTLTITYQASVKNTPRGSIFLQRLDDPNDLYLDILVSPPYNSTGLLVEHYSTGPRRYAVRPGQPPDEPTTDEGRELKNALEGQVSCEAAMGALGQAMETADTPPPVLLTRMQTACGMQDALKSVTEPQGCTPFESAADFVRCSNDALDSAAEAINDFNCSGGGCFPNPFNQAFLVPPASAFPLLAFPTTLPTPFGPVPFLWPGSFLGAAAIPGPIQSLFRLYISPTLTGGVGVAMCFGPYQGSQTAPPPVFPLPYPPPVGNCIVKALPMGSLSVCKKLEDIMRKIVRTMNGITSDINAGVAAINSNQGLPVGIETTDEQGAGGLEISLGVSLGSESRFTPPLQGFSNFHLPAFDAIGGVLASWVDRQTLEIVNKLFKLPTFSIILPDLRRLWSKDLSQTKALADELINSFNGRTMGADDAQALKSIDWSFKGFPEGVTEAGRDVASSLRIIENQGSLYEGPIEKIYDVINSIPFIELNETVVDFKIPWLSSGQIQDFIRDLEQWAAYMRRELDRAMNEWGQFICVDNFETADAASLQRLKEETGKTWEEIKQGCKWKQAADLIQVSMDDLLGSVDENIAVLQSYLTFPRRVIAFKDEFANYIRDIACYLEVYAQMFGGWLATIQEQVVSYAELWFTLVQIVEDWKQLFNLFKDFNDNCDICTNERFANFGWYSLLGVILPDLPIIRFPKWPDVVLDLSDFKGQVSLELPLINFVPEPIELPRLPYIRFPDVPSLSFLLQIPPLPILPRLPDLPDLPPLPPIPTVDLPTLPPPPKLPDFGAAFEAILPLVEKILQLWCIIKKSLTPIPESMLGDQIRLLTNRPAYLIPLDILRPKLPDIIGFDTGFNELRITTTVFIGARISALLEEAQSAAEIWNRATTNFADYINDGVREAQRQMDAAAATAQSKMDEFEQGLEDTARRLEDCVQSRSDDTDCTFEVAGQEIEVPRVQQEIDEFAEDTLRFGEINEAFRDAEDWLSEHTTEYLQEHIDEFAQSLNQDIVDQFQEWNEELKTRARSVADSLHDFMQTNAGQILRQVLEAASTSGAIQFLRYVNEQEVDEELEDALDEWNEEIRSMEQSALPALPINELVRLIEETKEALASANTASVDYKSLKTSLGVPDVRLPPQKTMVDKIEWMQEQLLTYSFELKEEAEKMSGVNELTALVHSLPEPVFPYELAGQAVSEKPQSQVTSSAVLPQKSTPLLAQDSPRRLAQALEGAAGRAREALETPHPAADTPCNGICIVDFETGTMAEVSALENSDTAVSRFIPTGQTGHSNLLYSDGTGLFLKEDLSVREPSDINQAPRVSNRIFSVDEFLNSKPIMEAVNMLVASRTADGIGQFEWFDTTNSLRYGYGIEMERSIEGFSADRQQNNQPDIRIVLLPKNADGSVPQVLVDGEPIAYGTLVTPRPTKEETRTIFGVKSPRTVTNAKKITFVTIGGATITLNPNLALYFDEYREPSFALPMENGFYHIRMTWFDRFGRNSTYNSNEVISPQPYVDTAPPVDILGDQEFVIPLYKARTISATEIFTDLSESLEYGWDLNGDSIIDQVGINWNLPAQNEPKEFTVQLIASRDLTDPVFPRALKTFKVRVYVPKISLEESPLQSENTVKGALTPEDPDHNLLNIPFSLFRKRWGAWKNLGLLKKSLARPTNPPLNDQEPLRDNYYAQTSAGEYEIKELTSGPPTHVIVKDGESAIAARVRAATGQIELLGEGYRLVPLPASETRPTRVAIVSEAEEQILSNVYYQAEENTDVIIRSELLNPSNVEPLGVTVGDANPNDDIIARNIPGYGPSYPGGVAIFNQTPPQINVALVNTDGAIRLMQEGYSLRLKNEGQLEERPIFQIVNSEDDPIFDIYIHADFTSPQIRQEETWNELVPTIGYLKKEAQGWLKEFLAHAQEASKTPATASPFADVDPHHPQFQSILDLYNRRVLEGYADGTFKPDAKISRAEFVKIALGVTNCFDCSKPSETIIQKFASLIPFPDVLREAWYFFCVSIAKSLGMITGYGDGLFRPERNISRAEAAAILLRQSGIEIQPAPAQAFLDVPDYAWYKDYVYKAVEIGLIKNNLGFVFPDEEITRGEFAFMARGLLNIRECRDVDTDGDGLRDSWEMPRNMDPFLPDNASLDADNDGLSAAEEARLGTDPFNPDTDGDGILDGEDLTPLGEAAKPPPALPPGTPLVFTDRGQVCACGNNPNQNDTDGDTFIDACDTDIDADGIENNLCLFDSSGLVIQSEIAASADNCVFNENPEQNDGDQNEVGDACEPTDLCPPVPEDLDGIDDLDGCPEVLDTTPDNPPGVYVNRGPLCYFLDYEADLLPGDTIMTAITDQPTHSILFEKSNEVPYE